MVKLLQLWNPCSSITVKELERDTLASLEQFPNAATKVTISSADIPYIKESVLHLYELGIKENVATHSLRKTTAFQIYRQTKDIALTMEILNHASVKTTFRYLSLTQDRIDEAFLNLDLGLAV